MPENNVKLISSNNTYNKAINDTTKKATAPDDIKVFDADICNVAQIDEFIKISSNKGVSHGEKVEKYIKSGIEESVKIEKFDTGKFTLNKVDSCLTVIIDKMKMGKHYDVLNISGGTKVNYKQYPSVTPKNLSEKKEFLKEELKKYEEETGRKAYSAIKKLETIADKGTKVVIASGNSNNGFNLLTLADGSISVGGLAANGKYKNKGSTDNSEVDVYEKSVYPITAVRNEKGFVGYDVTNDGKADFLTGELSPDILVFGKMIGTSFAAPTHSNKLIKEILNKK